MSGYNQKISFFVLSAVVVFSGIGAHARNFFWKDAITFWEDVAAKSFHKTRAHSNLALALYDQGMAREALERFGIGLRVAPSADVAAMVHDDMGDIYRKMGFYRLAIEELSAAIRLNPNEARPYNSMGGVYFMQGEMEKAIEAYTRALIIDDGFITARANLGLALEMNGQIDSAINQYRLALTNAPDHPGIRYNLGVAYRKKGFREEAIKEFEMAIKLNPFNEDARDALDSLLH